MAKGWPAGISRVDFLSWKKRQIANGVSDKLTVNDYRTQKTGGVWVAPIKEGNIKKGTKAENSADNLEEDEEKESPVIQADTEGYYGISFDRRNVIIWKRSKHDFDDVIVRNVGGEDVIKEIKAGDWKEWQHERGTSRGPFYPNIEGAKKYIKEAMVKEEVQGKKSAAVWREATERAHQRVEKAFGNV